MLRDEEIFPFYFLTANFTQKTVTESWYTSTQSIVIRKRTTMLLIIQFLTSYFSHSVNSTIPSKIWVLSADTIQGGLHTHTHTHTHSFLYQQILSTDNFQQFYPAKPKEYCLKLNKYQWDHKSVEVIFESSIMGVKNHGLCSRLNNALPKTYKYIIRHGKRGFADVTKGTGLEMGDHAELSV